MSADLATFSKALDATYADLNASLKKLPRTYQWRIEQLKALKRLLEENDEVLSQAMWKDLRKSASECQSTEQGVVLAEIEFTLKHLKKWMRPKKVSTPIYNQIGTSHIVHDPYGLVLIIGAWNYPLNLTLAPLVGAICGGNGAIVKPSEMAANTSQVIADLIPKYLDTNFFAVVQGGIEETNLVLAKRFDMIFFTGSGSVGKIILAKAAPHLTPVTLELGGKSPAVVLNDADVEVSARRLAWGKFMNAGQTCVAPDYIIVTQKMRDSLVAQIIKSLKDFYGEDAAKSLDYCRIINSKNFDRLLTLLPGADILHGGISDRTSHFIAPTIIAATPESAAMQDEIFGPILPILVMDDVEKILDFINSRPKPLALYLFTKDADAVQRFTNETSSGALCINDVVIHMPMASLPFGGVGASGMGHYHGRFSFETFTHAKGVLKKSFLFDVPLRYAPYTKLKTRILRWLFK